MIFSLKRVAEWNHNYLVSSLGSFGNRIIAGDQISSVSLLKVEEESLVSQAKDYGPLYPVSVEALDSDNIICANVSVVQLKYICSLFPDPKHIF
jgi:DNA damage-binding protein 1